MLSTTYFCWPVVLAPDGWHPAEAEESLLVQAGKLTYVSASQLSGLLYTPDVTPPDTATLSALRSLGPLLLDEAARWGRTKPTDAQRAEAGLAPAIRSNAQRAEAGFAPAIRSEADRLAAGREPRAARKPTQTDPATARYSCPECDKPGETLVLRIGKYDKVQVRSDHAACTAATKSGRPSLWALRDGCFTFVGMTGDHLVPLTRLSRPSDGAEAAAAKQLSFRVATRVP